MTTAEHGLQTLSDVEHHVKLLTEATRADQLLDAVSGYLTSWTKDRVENLQKIDGGWGTFDSRQRPEPIHGVADILRISDVLRNHCRALKDAAIEPTPELLELDLYFALAKQVAENLITVRPRPKTATSRNSDYRHWSDQDAVAA